MSKYTSRFQQYESIDESKFKNTQTNGIKYPENKLEPQFQKQTPLYNEQMSRSMPTRDSPLKNSNQALTQENTIQALKSELNQLQYSLDTNEIDQKYSKSRILEEQRQEHERIMTQFDSKIRDLEDVLRSEEMKLDDSRKTKFAMEKEGVEQQTSMVNDLHQNKNTYDNICTNVVKVKRDLEAALREFDNLKHETHNEFKYNTEFEKITSENFQIEVNDCRLRIKEQRQLNSDLTDEAHRLKIAMGDRIEHIADHLNKFEKEKNNLTNLIEKQKSENIDQKREQEVLKEDNIDLSHQKLNLIEAIEMQKEIKARQVNACLELDQMVQGEKNTAQKRAWGSGKGVRRSLVKNSTPITTKMKKASNEVCAAINKTDKYEYLKGENEPVDRIMNYDINYNSQGYRPYKTPEVRRKNNEKNNRSFGFLQ